MGTLYEINKIKPWNKQCQPLIKNLIDIYFMGFYLLAFNGIFGLVFIAFLEIIFSLSEIIKSSYL